VEPSIIARGTPGFSGADLANIVNEAALVAARKNRRSVTMSDFEQAKDKVFMGAERRSMAMSEDEKRLTAYHEGGHALVGLSLPDSDPVHKATIVPRGRALGMVMRLPEGDRYSSSRAKLKADLAVAMGGRVAEEIIFGHDKVTTGASSDIKMATDMARKMVTEWGLSDALGPLAYGEPEGDGFLGYASGQRKAMSNATAEQVDLEIRKVVQEGYETANRILTERLDDLHKLAHALLEHETLSGDDINTLLGGGTIDRTNTTHVGDAKSPPRRGSVPRSKPTIQPV
jgi:cell division protease FtsH